MKILTNKAITYLKANMNDLKIHYINGDDPLDWMPQEIILEPGEKIFEEIPDHILGIEELDMSRMGTTSKDDADAIKYVFLTMRHLNDSFAGDERVWAGLAHTSCYWYMQKRYNSKRDQQVDGILDHYFFNASNRPRCYITNGISRLWWYGRMLYEEGIHENEYDCFPGLDITKGDISGMLVPLFVTAWANSPTSRTYFFRAIQRYLNVTGNKLTRQLFLDLKDEMGVLQGIYAVGFCPEELIVSLLYNFLIIRSQEIKDEELYAEEHNIYSSGVEKFDSILAALNSIGGIGTMSEILKAYANLSDKPVSQALKNYISDSIRRNCPDDPDFDSKASRTAAMFYIINDNGAKKYKIANRYLTKDNIENRRAFIEQQLNTRSAKEIAVYNIITQQTATYKISNLLNYKDEFHKIHPEIKQPARYIKEGNDALCRLGLVERVGKDTYRKAYIV